MEILKLIKKPIGNTKIEYYVTVDGKDVTDAIEVCLGIIARSNRIYIPEGEDAETLLRKKLGDQRFEYLLSNHVMGRLSPQVINEQGELNLAFEPECTCDKNPQRDEDFEFTIHALLKPKYELTSYDPVEVTVPRYRMPEAAVDMQLEKLAEMNIVYKKVDDKGEPLKLGQYVSIDLTTTKDGVEIPGLTGKDRLLELNYEFMPKGFIDNIVGMKIGETKNFDFDGPKENARDENDTETFNCTVTAKELKRQMTPKITNAWVEVNVPDAGNLEGLRAQIRENLDQEADQQSQQTLSAMVDNELAKRFTGKVPDDIYEVASRSIYRNMRASLEQQGKTLEEFAKEQGMTDQQVNMQVMLQARDIIRQGFALDKYFEVKVGELTDEDIEQAYDSFSPGHADEVKKQFAETNRLYAVKEVAKRLKAHKELVETAIVHWQDYEIPMDDEQAQ